MISPVWWCQCAEVFFYFLFFIISILLVILLLMRECGAKGTWFFLVRLCKQELCRRRIKGQKRQSSRRTGSASVSREDTTIGTAQTDQTDKKEGHADTKRHTQQVNKQDHQEDLGSTQQTDTWVAMDNYLPILQPIRLALFLAFLMVFFFLIFFFLSVSFCCFAFRSSIVNRNLRHFLRLPPN